MGARAVLVVVHDGQVQNEQEALGIAFVVIDHRVQNVTAMVPQRFAELRSLEPESDQRAAKAVPA